MVKIWRHVFWFCALRLDVVRLARWNTILLGMVSFTAGAGYHVSGDNWNAMACAILCALAGFDLVMLWAYERGPGKE